MSSKESERRRRERDRAIRIAMWGWARSRGRPTKEHRMVALPAKKFRSIVKARNSLG